MRTPKISIFYLNMIANNTILFRRHSFSKFNHRFLSVSSNFCLDDEKATIFKKIIYCDSLQKSKKKKVPRTSNDPIFLQLLNEKNEVECKTEKSETVIFPYEVKENYLKPQALNPAVTDLFCNSVANFTPSDNEELVRKSYLMSLDKKVDKNMLEDPKRWVNDELVNDNVEDVIRFGTSDPNCPVSSVPCGGCGSLLQCSNMSIPGFLPKEIFKHRSEKELKSEICQRCHFLKEFDVALGVNVSSEEYPMIISQIQNKKALALLMVDLFDFPCSIWPQILDVIGSRPVIVVGNKIDLLIQEGSWSIEHIKECLQKSVEEQGILSKNILGIVVISAKTGFGIEELINTLHKFWVYKGDVYLIGCTNVGKSTLFNTLINSDYCKAKAVNVMQKATISAWPGTTLNLLKFPIAAPVGWKIYARKQRLFRESKTKMAFGKLVRNLGNVKLEQTPLTGYVGRTFNVENQNKFLEKDIFLLNKNLSDAPMGIDEKDPDFALTKWCYDTPGVVHNDQVINLLTTSELLLTVPNSIVIPRNFHLKPGFSIFIGGLARLDYVKGPDYCWFTVYSSKELPVTITKVEDADSVYRAFLGSEIFRVPFGDEKRLNKWPKFSSKKLQFCGKVHKEAAVDIVLSSAGWVSVTSSVSCKCQVEAWTPEGRGIHLREPGIIKKSHTFRGNRILRTPAYKVIMKEGKPLSILENSVYNS